MHVDLEVKGSVMRNLIAESHKTGLPVHRLVERILTERYDEENAKLINKSGLHSNG